MLQSKSSGFSSGGLAGGTVVPQSKILEKVEAQRTEINDLQAKVAGLEAKQIEYEQTLSCVDRQWTQINEDIIYMSRQARNFATHSGSETSTSGRDHVTGLSPVASFSYLQCPCILGSSLSGPMYHSSFPCHTQCQCELLLHSIECDMPS